MRAPETEVVVSEPYLSEIRVFGFNFPPKGWAFCNGQLLPINQNQPLFALLGTTYGGNGQTNFALPNLQGQTPMHFGQGYLLGQQLGEYNHTLTQGEMPAHPHQAFGQPKNASQPVPTNAFLATALNVYRAADNLTPLQPTTISNVGNSQPHANQQPYLTLSFCIALVGIFPSRN
jgi:microcystin-dependent protein